MRHVIDSKWALRGFTGCFIAFLAPRLVLYNGLYLLLLSSPFLGKTISSPISFVISPILLFLIILLLPIGFLNYYLVKSEWRIQHRGQPGYAGGTTNG